jgi:hypothetical protein
MFEGITVPADMVIEPTIPVIEDLVKKEQSSKPPSSTTDKFLSKIKSSVREPAASLSVISVNPARKAESYASIRVSWVEPSSWSMTGGVHMGFEQTLVAEIKSRKKHA